jgi:hypothetical protein
VVEERRYTALQRGYREALLAQLDFLIGEMLDEGDFSPAQIRPAVEVRLDGGTDSLRAARLAEDRKERFRR